jgi:hypothetical protein
MEIYETSLKFFVHMFLWIEMQQELLFFLILTLGL